MQTWPGGDDPDRDEEVDQSVLDFDYHFQNWYEEKYGSSCSRTALSGYLLISIFLLYHCYYSATGITLKSF